MANRSFHPPAGNLELDVVNLFGTITVGASGAVTTGVGKGIASVVKESAAGQYTITLSDTYNTLLMANFMLLDGTDESPATVGTHMRLNSQAVSNATPTLVLQCYAGDDGADANPADGAVIYFQVVLRNSSVS